MDEFVKKIIEETFKSKKQQRLFFAKANDKKLSKKERNKWSKWAKEFSDDTDYDKIPEVAETDVDEIVDDKGNILRKKTPEIKDTKGGKIKTTTDKASKTAYGQMGVTTTFGLPITGLRYGYYAESDLSKGLGADDTILKGADYDDAEEVFKDELGLKNDAEREERMGQLGYSEKLPDDEVYLIENPKQFVKDYVESIIKGKSVDHEIVEKETEDSEVNPIILRQIQSLKHTMEKNNISAKQILNLLKKDE